MHEERAEPAPADEALAVGRTTTGRTGDGRHRVGLRVTLAVLVLAGLAAAAVIAGRGDDRQDPGEALARSKALVRDATGFRFTMAGTYVAGENDDDPSDDHGTARGEWTPDRFRMVTQDSSRADEYLVDGATSYSRTADDVESLETTSWTSETTPEVTREQLVEQLKDFRSSPGGPSDQLTLSAAVLVCLGPDGVTDSGLGVDPVGFLRSVQQMASPTVVPDTDAALTLAADLQAPEELVEAFGRPIPTCAVELDLAADGWPTALRFNAAAGGASLTFEMEFSDWNAPIEIAVPSPDQVDPESDDDSAEVEDDELDDLRTLHDLAPVFPTSLPDGWELASVQVFLAQNLYDPSYVSLPDTCEALAIEIYGDGPSDTNYLAITELTSECALLTNDTPFAPGGPRGLQVREVEIEYEISSVQYLTGETVVEVYSSLDEAEHDAVVASLTPVDIDALVDMAVAAETRSDEP